MTRREAREAHIKQWTWLKENPDKGEEDWSGWMWLGGQYHRVAGFCFACVVVAEGNRRCSCCPIRWTGGLSCMHKTAEFWRWANSKTTRTRKRLAAKIAAMWPEEKE